MLRSIDNNRIQQPHLNSLSKKFDTNKINTSSWIPGSNWTNTPYQIIYDKACLANEHFSAQTFKEECLQPFTQSKPSPTKASVLDL
jgi:hypothetical protein